MWSLALTGLLAPLTWFLRGAIEQGRTNAEAISTLHVEMHRDFATKNHVEVVLARIDERFDRVEDKMDRLLAQGAKR